MRRRRRPQRRVADEILVARVSDGSAVLLNPMATLIWDALEGWQDEDGLVAELARRFPDVGHEERTRAVSEALQMLDREDLLEHGEP